MEGGFFVKILGLQPIPAFFFEKKKQKTLPTDCLAIEQVGGDRREEPTGDEYNG